MPLKLTPAPPGTTHSLAATPATCYWGYIDRDQPPCLTVSSGDVIEVEAITHHAGDAPDLLMDDGIRAIWSGIPVEERGPGVHILTGPVAVAGAEPGDTLLVHILEMTPRLPHGSNCAANWGLLHDRFGKERITIYGLDVRDGSAEFPATPDTRPAALRRARSGARREWPAVVDPAECVRRQRRQLAHRPGATMAYPVFAPGANLYVGDPHFAQGDGEICGTAIEASLTARIQVSVAKGIDNTSPLLHTASHWYTHGFGADLDAAMRMAAEQMLWLLQRHAELSAEEAYSLASVAMDLGVTQVVDGTVGCHAGIAHSVFD